MNSRRKLVITLGAGALAVPFASFAQQSGKVWRVGYLQISSSLSGYVAFEEALLELNYIKGKSVIVERRLAEGRSDRLSGLATELVDLKLDVIVAGGTPAIRAAQKATATIPIVMVNAGDPIGSGFVKSLAHPGGNITGLSSISADISAKHLEMLHNMVPKLSRVAILVNPANSSHVVVLENVLSAAKRTNTSVLSVAASNSQDIETAFITMNKEKSGALIVTQDGLFLQQRRQIGEIAAKNGMPTIAGANEYVEAGALMSYGTNLTGQFRRAAYFVDRILKGAKPADLPVEQPMTFELVINAKTAKALGLKIPHSLQMMANKVIE